jgi:hypothetical protein
VLTEPEMKPVLANLLRPPNKIPGPLTLLSGRRDQNLRLFRAAWPANSFSKLARFYTLSRDV